MKLPLICSFFYVDVIKTFPHLLTLINGNSILFQGLFSRGKSHLLRLSLPIQLLCQFFENFERAGQEGSDNNDCDSNSDETEGEICKQNPTDQPEDEPKPGDEPKEQEEPEEETEDDPETQNDPHVEPVDGQINEDGPKIEIGAPYIKMAASIVKCSLTQLCM